MVTEFERKFPNIQNYDRGYLLREGWLEALKYLETKKTKRFNGDTCDWFVPLEIVQQEIAELESK